MPASAGVRFPAIHLPEIDPMKRGPRKGLPLWGTRRTGCDQGYEVKKLRPLQSVLHKKAPIERSGPQLVEKVCRTAGFFLWDVFSRTCAGKKHRNPPIFRKKSVKPARRPEPRPFWAAPRVRRMAREPVVRATRAYQIKWGPRKTCFAGSKTQRSGFSTVSDPDRRDRGLFSLRGAETRQRKREKGTFRRGVCDRFHEVCALFAQMLQ